MVCTGGVILPKCKAKRGFSYTRNAFGKRCWQKRRRAFTFWETPRRPARTACGTFAGGAARPETQRAAAAPPSPQGALPQSRSNKNHTPDKAHKKGTHTLLYIRNARHVISAAARGGGFREGKSCQLGSVTLKRLLSTCWSLTICLSSFTTSGYFDATSLSS